MEMHDKGGGSENPRPDQRRYAVPSAGGPQTAASNFHNSSDTDTNPQLKIQAAVPQLELGGFAPRSSVLFSDTA